MRPFREWFFTAPLEDIAVRRGDPLGMRSVADAAPTDVAEILKARARKV